MSARMPTVAELSLAEFGERIAHYRRVAEAPGTSRETVRRLRLTIARMELIEDTGAETGITAEAKA